ncbi:MAG: hypothetical protein WCY88_15930 [Spongiibacteraceae bacterium]
MTTAPLTTQATIRLDDYQVTDSYFGQPYIDRDEWRQEPIPHRNIHGGFADCDTRFNFYFPAQEGYQNRMFQPIEGAHAGHEDAFIGLQGQIIGGLPLIARLGGFMVESNSGHIGDDIDPRAGEDPTLYGHRASVESARLSKFVAAQIYGAMPAYSYVWGGSGGGRRSPLCFENGQDVYQGAMPFMGGGTIDKLGSTDRIRTEQPVHFGCMFNVQRVLGDKISSVIDAMQPGGSGNPFEDLNTHQREELNNLYRLGYPRGDEYMIANPMGQIWLWTSIADMLQQEDAEFFNNFWTKPGYVGFDHPNLVNNDLIDIELSVTKVITASELLQSPSYAGPEYAKAKPMAMLMASKAPDFPIAIEVKGLPAGYLLGTGVKVTSGKAKGRQLYCMNFAADVMFCDGHGEANLQRFTGVEAGDKVHIDNHAFLAFCYSYRHHISDDPSNDFLRIDGAPLYPQHGLPLQSSLMGVAYSGDYNHGKLMWVHHTHDASLWPPQGLIYKRGVEQAQGKEKAAENFCLRWTDNAEHVPPMFAPPSATRANNTWLIDYGPVIEQCLADLCDWVENGNYPAPTQFSFEDGRVTLPASASERGGIQPVVSIAANGSLRAEISAGETVSLTMQAEVPPNAGTIIDVEWDFDGMGKFPEHGEVDGTQTNVSLSTQHRYDKAGTYFATARVTSHRQGDINATCRRVTNLASARIVVA